MSVYIFMIISTTLMSIGAVRSKKSGKKSLEFAFKIMMFSIPFLVMGFRYGIGQDYFYTYVPVFQRIKLSGTYAGVELGYVFLNKLVLFFTKDYLGIFILTSALFCGFIYKAIWNNSKDVVLSEYILFTSCFYFYAMNVVRQSIVIAIFIFSLKYIKEKKLGKYIITILLASLIHKIAFIFIPIYFIADLKIDLRKIILLVCTVIIGTTIINNIIVKIVSGTKYENYITGKYVVSENSMISPFINAATLLLCLYYKKKDRKQGIEDKELNLLTNIHIVALLSSLLLGSFPLASRIFLNFYHVQLITIPLLLQKEKRKQMRMLMYILYVIGFGTIFAYSVGYKNGNKVLPYRTIFDR